MSDPTDFYRLLQLIGRTDTIRFARGDSREFKTFPVSVDPDRLGETLTFVEELGQNAWFEVQPSRFSRPFGRSDETDITAIRAIYADIDFKGGDASRPGMGSEPAARDLIDMLTAALGTPPAAIVLSGHGLQPYWPVSGGDITETNAAEMKALLKRFGALVASFAGADGGHVDNVFDLPRILRVPGVTNVKDPANPEDTGAEFLEGNFPISIDELVGILDEYEIDVPQDVEIGYHVESPSTDWEWAEANCSFHAKALAEIADSTPTSRHQWAIKWSAIIHGMIRGGCITEAGYVELRDALMARFAILCQTQQPVRPMSEKEFREVIQYGLAMAQKWSKVKLGAELRGHTHDVAEMASPALSNVSAISTQQRLTEEQVASVASAVPGTDGALALSPVTHDRLMHAAFTDTGNAELLGTMLQNRFRFMPGLGWYEWSGHRYVLDTSGKVIEATKDTFMAMASSDSEARSKWGRKSLSKGGITAALSLAETTSQLFIDPLGLDSAAEDLVTPGGIVNLASGQLRPGDPLKDFNSQMTAYTPDYQMKIPHYREFLAWCIGDKARIDYMQRIAGLALIGELRHHIFPIWLGVGGNGKSVLADIWSELMGDYSIQATRKFLVEGTEPHPEVIARLRSKRFLVTSEVPQGARFAEDLVKQITGEQTLTGRFMHKDSITFKNTCLTIQLANHQPSVPGGGYSFWRRTRKIDFENVVPLDDVNPMLGQQLLAAEGPGILAWMIEGARLMIEDGKLDTPEKVKVATKGYELEEDYIGRFLNQTVQEAEGVQIDRAFIYDRYRVWAIAQGLNPMNAIRFGREVSIHHPRSTLAGDKVFTNMNLLMPKVVYQDE